jgi:hypothetical protein
VNIFLIPHTLARHVAVGLVVGGAGLLGWWGFVQYVVWLGPTVQFWGLLPSLGAEGPWLLGLVAGAIAGASVLAEQSLYRAPLWRRIALPIAAAAAAFGLTVIGYTVTQFVHRYLLTGEDLRPIASDPSVVSLRFRVLSWLSAGSASGLAPVLVRRFQGFFSHFFGGLTSAGFGAFVWHVVAYRWTDDLYLSAALGCFTWGLLHGLLVWPIPSSLYAGWVRVLSNNRYAWRVPVDHENGTPSERFIGHFPRGLDVYLPVEDGVAELHTSFVVDADHHYSVRGLSQQPTLVKRLLERIDLRYDPRRPAPLETPLHMEDRILMGPPGRVSEVEFLLLPKEER